MSPFKSFRLLLALALAVLLSGCGFSGRIEEPRREPLFDQTVDSVVVRPFSFPPDTDLTTQDLEKMAEMLGAELATRPWLKVFQTPPTDLPNTLILEPRIALYQRRDLKTETFFLREIHLEIQVSVFQGDSEEPVKRFSRKYSYQRVLAPEEPVPELRQDQEKMAGEVAEEFAEALFPNQEAEPIVLDSTFDPETGKIHAQPRLVEANSLAESNRLDAAWGMWRLVLFDPGVYDQDDQFLLSFRSLNLLEKQAVPKDALERMKPMVTLEEEDLVGFRTQLRAAVGGVTDFEGKVLVAAQLSAEKLHRNLAAAHNNLGSLAAFDKRKDVAAFHFARAYAHYPTRANLERWAALQKKRGLMPAGLTDAEAITLYLRVPPPRALDWTPGSRDREVLPVGVVEALPLPAPPQPPAAAAVQLPPASPGAETPPPGRPGAPNPDQPDNLPPIQNLERAGRGG